MQSLKNCHWAEKNISNSEQQPKKKKLTEL